MPINIYSRLHTPRSKLHNFLTLSHLIFFTVSFFKNHELVCFWFCDFCTFFKFIWICEVALISWNEAAHKNPMHLCDTREGTRRTTINYWATKSR